MRKMIVGLAMLLATTVAGAAGAGATVEIVKVRDKSLLASFLEVTNQGTCQVVPAVDVQWNTSLIRADGTTTMQSVVVLSLHYVSTCGDDITMTGFALDTNGSVANDLSHGHLDAVVPVATDPEIGPQLTANITVHLDFTATGPANTIRDRSHSRDGAVITINNFMVSSRPGVATGTITGTLPLIGGPTPVVLASQPSISAQIGKDGNGSITIVRKTP